jgi:hypothetical protein
LIKGPDRYIPTTDKEKKLREIKDFYLGMLMDSAEILLDGTKEWTKLRPLILKVFGDKGLEGKIRELL